MSREYSMQLPATASLTTTPFCQIATPSTTSIEIVRIEIGQELSIASAALTVSLTRRSTATTMATAQTATTMGPLNENDPASLMGLTTTTNGYGIGGSAGTLVNTLYRWNFNALSGLLYLPVPEERVKMKPSSFITLQFAVSPGTLTISGHIIFAELS